MLKVAPRVFNRDRDELQFPVHGAGEKRDQ